MRLLLLLAFFVLVSGCICCLPPGDDWTQYSTTTVSTKKSTTTVASHESTTTTSFTKKTTTTLIRPGDIKDKSSCEALGGTWRRIGLSPRESCNLPTSDGGKECSDASECEGACIAELSGAELENAMHGSAIRTKGKCTQWRITVGCQARVEDGVVHGMLCVD